MTIFRGSKQSTLPDGSIVATQSSILDAIDSAQQAQAAAEQVFDDFDDRYLGAKTVDPTQDNNGEQLTTGSLYYNTTDLVLKVYNGSQWEAIALNELNVRDLFSASGDLSYNSNTGEFSVNVPAGYDSSDFDTDFSNRSTDDLSEGVNNLYFIEAPEDGGQYVRKDASWIEVDLSSATVDLGTTVSSNSIVVTNTGGTDATIPAADANNAGLVSTFSQTFDGIKTFQNEIRCENDIVAFHSSDSRLKENINDIQGALASLDKIRGVEYDWTEKYLASKGGEDNAFTRKHDVGVIAQELQEVLPEAVLERSDGFMGVRYEKIVPLLLQAVKELKSELDELKQEK